MANGTTVDPRDEAQLRHALRGSDGYPPPIAEVLTFVSKYGCERLMGISFDPDELRSLRSCLLPVLWGDGHRKLESQVCKHIGPIATKFFADVELAPVLAFHNELPSEPSETTAPPARGTISGLAPPNAAKIGSYKRPTPTAPNASTASA